LQKRDDYFISQSFSSGDGGVSCYGCGWCSTNSSTAQFDFNLTPLEISQAEKDSEGSSHLFFAKPCGGLSNSTVGNFSGTCAPNMTACYCTTDFGPTGGECVSIGYASTAIFQDIDPWTLAENTSAPSCLFNNQIPWLTTIIYTCSNRLLTNTNFSEIQEISYLRQYCAPADELCYRCLQLPTDAACPASIGSISINSVTVGSNLVINFTYSSIVPLGSIMQVQVFIDGIQNPQNMGFTSSPIQISNNINIGHHNLSLRLVALQTAIYSEEYVESVQTPIDYSGTTPTIVTSNTGALLLLTFAVIFLVNIESYK